MSQTTLDSNNLDSSECVPIQNRTLAVFLISVLGLFLELLLIRWIGTEIRIFAYLQNTVLVVCFMGLGMGCFGSRAPFVLRDLLQPLFVLTLVLSVPVIRKGLGMISDLLSTLSDLVIWEQQASASPWTTALNIFLGLILTFVLTIFIWDVFVPIGRLLGRLMDEHPRPIVAYSANIVGSLVGIWLFMLLSVSYQPPITWFGVLCLLVLPFLTKASRDRFLNVSFLLATLCLSWLAGRESDAMEVMWSPYQKLVLKKLTLGDTRVGDYLITVNNAMYQGIIDLGDEHVESDPERYPPELRGLSQYDIPFLLHPNPQTALIVGAGAGNDVAGGLRQGVNDIKAVEIDPAIISMGRRFHPEKPYDSPRVRVVIDDARSFFARSRDRYDVISFGLLDSHTTTAMTNARLDHYVYTKESLQQAKALLSEGGVLVLNFAASRPFIADRMGRVLRDVFGEEPMCFHIPESNWGWGGIMFVAGDLQAARTQLAGNDRLLAQITQWQHEYPLQLPYTTREATDDWPYVYLERPRIPVLYFLLAGMLLLLVVRARLKLKGALRFPNWTLSHWHFFFLGAAFLLLEVQNISKASAILGNTWWVNAVIISSVLIMIVLANVVASQWPNLPLGLVYGALCGTCVALYFVDMSRFAFLPYLSKAIVVGGLTCLPMLFGGIAFIRSFAGELHKDTALGANLIGSLVGGLLQSITFVVGIKALLLIVTALYVCAILSRPRDVHGQLASNPA